MASSLTALAPIVRKDFRGKTDYYATGPYAALPKGTLEEAKAGIAPFDPSGGLITEAYREESVARLSRYRLGWDFFRVDHFNNPYDDGELKTVVNFCKKIVDSAVDWFVADGWCVTSPSGNELVAELLNKVWEFNRRKRLTETLVQFGAITGDMYFYVTVATKDENGKPLPKNKWYVKITPLNPANVFPFWNPNVPGEMLGCLVQYPSVNEEGEDVLLSLYITADSWELYQDEKKISEAENPFGKVNVVHSSNFVLSNSNFGQNDIHQVIPLNEEYNLTLNAIRRIIKYHAEPTTVIFGVRAGDLEKGAKKVWSNLPKDAKVENLQLQADLTASYSLLDRLERLTGELSSTPRVIFDSEKLSLSNTSGLAMQMMFQPLIEKTRKRRTNYTSAVQRVNELILIAHEKILSLEVSTLADDLEQVSVTGVDYTSPLPRDEHAELDSATKKIAIGVWSRAEAMRRLSGVPDFSRLVLEIAADERYKIAAQYEMQRANNGMEPNLSVVFLNSSTLSEDFEPVAEATEPSETE